MGDKEGGGDVDMIEGEGERAGASYRAPDGRRRNMGFSWYPPTDNSPDPTGAPIGEGVLWLCAFGWGGRDKGGTEVRATDDASPPPDLAATPDTLADSGNGFLGITLLELSKLDRGDFTLVGRC